MRKGGTLRDGGIGGGLGSLTSKLSLSRWSHVMDMLELSRYLC